MRYKYLARKFNETEEEIYDPRIHSPVMTTPLPVLYFDEQKGPLSLTPEPIPESDDLASIVFTSDSQFNNKQELSKKLIALIVCSSISWLFVN